MCPKQEYLCCVALYKFVSIRAQKKRVFQHGEPKTRTGLIAYRGSEVVGDFF